MTSSDQIIAQIQKMDSLSATCFLFYFLFLHTHPLLNFVLPLQPKCFCRLCSLVILLFLMSAMKSLVCVTALKT